MPDGKNAFQEVLPKHGMIYEEDTPKLVLCKPKLLPLKSVTLEKLEKMQAEAQEKVKQQEEEAQKAAESATKESFGMEGEEHIDRLTLEY